MIDLETFEYKKYLQSNYWKGIKEQVLEMDDYKCIVCGAEDNLCIHHTTYEYLEEEHLDKLVTLCRKCHYKYHKNNQLNFNNYKYLKKVEKILEQKKLEDKIFLEHLQNNIDEIQKIVDIIDKTNYIKYTEMIKYIYKIAKSSFNKYKFFVFVLDYFDLVFIMHCHEEIISKYNLPHNISYANKNIIITKRNFYLENKKYMSIVHRIYNEKLIPLIDVRTLF